MNAGTMRHAVVLQEVTEATGAGGGVLTRTWSTVATVYAAVRPLTGRELLQHGVPKAGITHRVTIRKPVHRSTGAEVRPTPDMRLVHETTRHLYISQVIEVAEAGFFYELLCEERIS
jgi:head-tail adaptor